jgi:phosphate ABC transporter permease subunit PstA
VEGRRKATDASPRSSSPPFVTALIPLVSVVFTVVRNGVVRMDAEFFASSIRGVVGEGGGAYHAVTGTLIITGLTALMSIPVGMYGKGRLAKITTFFVDVMTGILSIVAGLFAVALFTQLSGPGIRLGFAGAVALSVLMIPVVARATEEMLKIVPNELREAAFALGVPKWRTILKVVIPTSVAGIASGVTLAIARVIGETAPLLIAVGLTAKVNLHPFDGRMATLRVFSSPLRVGPLRLTPTGPGRPASDRDRAGFLPGDGVDRLPGDGDRVVGEALVVPGQQGDVHGRGHPVRPGRMHQDAEHPLVHPVHGVVVGVEFHGHQHVVGAHHLGRLEGELDRDLAHLREVVAHLDGQRRRGMAHPHDLGDVQREVAHPFDVPRRSDRGHHRAEVARHRRVEQQGVPGEVLDLRAQRVDRRVSRDHLFGQAQAPVEHRRGGSLQRPRGRGAHLPEQLGQLIELLR